MRSARTPAARAGGARRAKRRWSRRRPPRLRPRLPALLIGWREARLGGVRLGRNEEADETLDRRPGAVALWIARLLGFGEGAACPEDREKGSGFGADRRVGGFGAAAGRLDRPAGDGDAEAILAEAQLEVGLQSGGGLELGSALEFEHDRVRSHRPIERQRRRAGRPAAKRKDRVLELSTPVGQGVDARAGRGRELLSLDDAGPLELAQPLGDDVRAGVGEPPLEIGEALRAEQQLAHPEQRPAPYNEVACVRDRAGLAVCPRRRHPSTIAEES